MFTGTGENTLVSTKNVFIMHLQDCPSEGSYMTRCDLEQEKITYVSNHVTAFSSMRSLLYVTQLRNQL